MLATLRLTSSMNQVARAAIAALALVLLTACGGSGDGATASGDHNRADVTFLRQMIPHHRQAVMMTLLADTRDAGPQVRDLATRIEDAQRREIGQMSDWLESWDEGYGHGDMGGMYDDDGSGDGDGMMGDGNGMLDGGQMRDLVASRGAAFDRLFLTLMIEHHEGALEMTSEEQAEGENKDVIVLAKEMEKVQTAEIAEMRRLLAG